MCSVNMASVMFKPCGHLVACGSCSSLMRKCVQCRIPISQQVPINIGSHQRSERGVCACMSWAMQKKTLQSSEELFAWGGVLVVDFG